MDSRVLLYPLMRALHRIGSIIVFTNDKFVTRLIDNEYSGEFRNIEIVYDDNQTADEMRKEFGVASDDYDFIIYDNVGTSSYDKLLGPICGVATQDFEDSIDDLRSEDNVCIIKFGKNKGSTKKDENSEKEKPVKLTKEEKEAKKWLNFNPSKKFRDKMETDEQKKSKQVSKAEVPMPNFQEIEDMEALHIFPNVNRSLISIFYSAFGADLNIDSYEFTKEVRTKDESGTHIARELTSREDEFSNTADDNI